MNDCPHCFRPCDNEAFHDGDTWQSKTIPLMVLKQRSKGGTIVPQFP